MSRSTFYLPVLVFLMLIQVEVKAKAHAFLNAAEPAVGSQVATSPSIVKLSFTREISLQGSQVQVVNEQGDEVDRHDLKIDPSDPRLLEVSVSSLPRGKYAVRWKVTCSSDKHVTSGRFVFEVTG